MLRLLRAFSLGALASVASAQLTQVANTGCSDGVVGGGAITSFANGVPTSGNLLYTLEYTCPSPASHAIMIVGLCQTSGSPVNWDLNNVCFSSWTAPPTSCGMAFSTVSFLSGAPLNSSTFLSPFPIPSIPGLPAFTQANPICFQVVCLQIQQQPILNCVEVSAGAQLIVQ